jgi:hypothetical protein
LCVLLLLLFVCPAELRAACSKERKTGKAPPKRLTTHQRQIVERLVKAHGDDVQVCGWSAGAGRDACAAAAAAAAAAAVRVE